MVKCKLYSSVFTQKRLDSIFDQRTFEDGVSERELQKPPYSFTETNLGKSVRRVTAILPEGARNAVDDFLSHHGHGYKVVQPPIHSGTTIQIRDGEPTPRIWD